MCHKILSLSLLLNRWVDRNWELLWWQHCQRWHIRLSLRQPHHNDAIVGAMASQITSLTIVYSIVYSGVDQRKHQSSASLALVRGIHRLPVNSPRKWPVTRKNLAIWWRHHATAPLVRTNLASLRFSVFSSVVSHLCLHPIYYIMQSL